MRPIKEQMNSYWWNQYFQQVKNERQKQRPLTEMSYKEKQEERDKLLEEESLTQAESTRLLELMLILEGGHVSSWLETK